ncbi:hypothetical protein ACFE04_002852 [Oxalis oulophora]
MEKVKVEEEYIDEDNSNESESDIEEEEEEEEIKWKKHYSSKQRILLIGDGDFSFSLCLARAFGSARNMVSTSLESQENIESKYGNGMENVRELEERGCLVLFGVDAKQMSQHFFLTTQSLNGATSCDCGNSSVSMRAPCLHYNVIMGACKSRSWLGMGMGFIMLNKRLVKGFLSNSKVLLKQEEGEIHITNKEGFPYNKWDLVRKAEKIGLVLHETVPFYIGDYPAYRNKRAHGSHPDDPFHLGNCSTYKFRTKHAPMLA